MKTKTDIQSLYGKLRELTQSIVVTDRRSKVLDLSEAVSSCMKLLLTSQKQGGKVMFVGNGASACISSHMAADFLKNGKIRAIAFNDAAFLTCLSNDLGYEHVFEKPIEMLAHKNDVLIAVSSSGKSPNILRAVEMSRRKGCPVVTLSGFKKGNPLSRMGDINFYVPAEEYSHVEIVHHSICHYILDLIIASR